MKRGIKIKISQDESVRGILQMPDDAWCLMVLAHGAGAGMEHPFMQQVADRLENSGVATLRVNFLYMEKGGGRPDLPRVAQRVLRAAVERAHTYADKNGIAVIGAGKSFGGRMFSHLMASSDPPVLSALVFFGFPLHAPGKQGKERADHLYKVKVPMLFLQGTRDTLAQIDLINEVVKGLRKASITIVDHADHSFHVPKKSGQTDAQVLDYVAEQSTQWLRKKLS